MADLQFTADIQPKIDPSQMTSGINQIQQQFSKLKLPDSLKQSFADATKSATKAVQEYQAIIQKPVKTKTDQTNLDKAGQRAIQEFTKLESIVKNISTTDMRAEFHVDTKEVQLLEQQLKELKASLSESKSGFLEGISSALDQLPSKSSAIDVLKNKLQDTTVTAEQLSPELQRLTSNIISFTSKATLDKKFEEDLKSLKTAIDEVVTALSEGNFEQAASKFGDIENSLQSLNEKGFDTTKVGNYTTALKSAIDQTKQLSDLDMSKTAQDIDDITQKLEQIDAKAFAEMEAKVKQLETQVEQLNKALQDNHNKTMAAADGQRQFNTQVGQLKSRIEYFFGLTNAVQLFRRALQNTFNTVKELDASMTETAVVTDFTVGDMWDQLPQYTATAKEFGATIKGVYDVMTLYYQQGLDQDTAWALGTETLKLARIAGLEYAEATDRMTNALRGFNMELNQQNAQRVDDVYSKLAAMSASNVDELSVAMTKTASIAKSANMEFETTAAFLAQIIETTREAPETAGTALKTVIARFSEVKDLYTKGQLTGEDSEGEVVDVNKVSKALSTAGIDMSKYFTGEVGLDTIFMQLAEKWDSLDLVQQRYIATQAAGSRQQSRFIAMLSDYGRTLELVEGAENATGASEQQFEKTQESLQTKLNRLKDTWQEFSMGLANNQVIKGAVDELTKLLEIVNKLTQGTGDFSSTFLKMTSLIIGFKGASNLFNKGIGKFAAKFGAGMKEGAGEEIAGQIVQPKTLLGRTKERAENFVAANQTKKGARGFAAFRTNKEIDDYNKDTVVKHNERRKVIGLPQAQELKTSEQMANEITVTSTNTAEQEKNAQARADVEKAANAEGEAIQNTTTAEQTETTTSGNITTEKEAESSSRIENANAAETEEASIDEVNSKNAENVVTSGAVAEANEKTAISGEAVEEENMDIVTSSEGIVTTDAEIVASQETLQYSYEATGLSEQNLQAENADLITSSKGVVTSNTEIVVSDQLVQTENTKTALSFRTLGIAIKNSLLPILPIILAVGAAVGAVALAIKAYNASIENSPVMKEKRAMEGLNNGSNLLSESIGQAQNAVAELKDSLEEFNSIDYFNGAIKGTTEWYEKVLQQNEKVFDLLEKYKSYNLTASYDDNGLLQLDNAGEVIATLQEQEKRNILLKRLSSALTDEYTNTKNYNEKLNNNYKEFMKNQNGTPYKYWDEEVFSSGRWLEVDGETAVKMVEAIESQEEGHPFEAAGKYVGARFDNIWENGYNFGDVADTMSLWDDYIWALGPGFLKDINPLTEEVKKNYENSPSKANPKMTNKEVLDYEKKHLEDQAIANYSKIFQQEYGASVAAGNYAAIKTISTEKYGKAYEKGLDLDETSEEFKNILNGLGYFQSNGKWYNAEGIQVKYDENNKIDDDELRQSVASIYATDKLQSEAEETVKEFNKEAINEAQRIFSGQATAEQIQAIAGIMGKDYSTDISSLEDVGGFFPSELYNNLIEIQKYQKGLANKGLGLFGFNFEGFNPYKEISSDMIVAMDQFKNLDASGQQQIVRQFELLEKYDKPELLENYKKAMSDIAKVGGNIEDLKFTNLIEFNAQAERLAKSTDNYVDTIDLFHELGTNGALENMNDQLTEFIEKNGQITSDNIKDLAKQYPILSDYIESAEEGTDDLDKATYGLAHTLTYIKTNGKSYADITKNILAAASATRTLGDITAEMSDFVDNFSAATSNYKGMDFFKENIETVQEFGNKGRWGDAELKSYLGSMFSDEYLADHYKDEAGVRTLSSEYTKYATGGGFNILKDIISNFKGEDQNLLPISGYSIDTKALEGMTTEQIYDLFKKYGGDKFSKGAIDSAISTLLSRDVSLSSAITQNDAEAAVNAVFEKNKDEGSFLISEDEIDSIAGITGATNTTIRNLFSKFSQDNDIGPIAATIPKFVDEKGKELEGRAYVDAVLGRSAASVIGNSEYSDEYKNQYANYVAAMAMKGAAVTETDENGNIISDGLYHKFAKKDAKGNVIYENGKAVVDTERLGESFDIDAIDEFISHLDAASRSKFWDELATANPDQTYTKNYSYYDTTTDKQVHLSATGKTKEEAEDEVEARMQDISYEKMGQQIAKAFKDVEINVSLDSKTTKDELDKIDKAIQNVFPDDDTRKTEVDVSIDNSEIAGGLNAISTQIDTYIDSHPKTITIKLKPDDSELPDTHEAKGQNNHNISGLASGTVKNGPVKHKNEIVLTGEIGPELIQYADGGAYLTGSNGPEMTQISPDDIVYTADQTKKIFANGGFSVKRAEDGIGNSYKRFASWAGEFETDEITDDEDKTEVDVEVNITLEDLQTYNSALENDSPTTFFQDTGTELLSRGVAPFDTGMSIGESMLVGDYVGAYHTLQGYQQQLQNQDPVATVDQIIEAIKNGTSSIHDAVIDLKDDGQLKDSTLRNLPGSATMANDNLDNLSMEKTSEILKTHQEDYNKELEISNKRLDRLKQVESKLSKSQTATLAVQTLETAEMGKQLVTLKKQFDETNAIYQKKKEEFNNGKYGKYFQADSLGNITKTEAGKKADPKMLAGLQEEGDFKAFSAIAGMQGDAFSALFTGGLDFIGGIQSMFDTGKGIFDTMKGYAEKIAQYITQAIEVVVSAWTNRKDWLYNFLNRIEKELHEFAKLQEYANQIDEGRVVSYQELMKNWDDQFESLQKQLEMQNERVEARQQYLDWSKFIPFTLISGWSPVTDTLYENRTVKFMWDLMIGFGQMVPMFGDVFKSLDELYKDYDKRVQENYEDRLEAEKAILEIETERLKLVKAGAEEATQFEEKVMDAFIQKEQEAIDELSRLNEAITGANQTLLDTLKDNLEQVRRIRENTDKEEDLTDKEIRLAYLRQDTSNANLNEIKKLEKDLEKENESYTDKLIDQRIDDLSKQNEDAAEQRQKQIDLLQGQLDWAKKYGVYWDHIYGMLYTVDEYGNIGLNQENFDERGFLRANGELSKMLNTFSDLIGESIWKTLMDNEELKKLGVYYNAFVQYNGNEGIWRRQDMLQNPDINDNGYVSWWEGQNAGPIVQFLAKIEDDWNDFWMNNDLGLWNDTVYYLRKIEDVFLKIWGWITGQSFSSRAEAWKKEGGFKSEYDNNPVVSGLYALFTGQWQSWRNYNRAADGTNHATAGKWLVGEEGPELIQFANGGAYLAGTQGPEMVNLSNGDKVYNNSDTKGIFNRGPSFGRLAEGNATLALTEPKWIEDLVDRGINQLKNLTKNSAENNRTIVNEVHINIDNMNGTEENAEDVAQVVIDRLDEIAKYRSTNYIDHTSR